MHVVDERDVCLGYPRLGYPSAGISDGGRGDVDYGGARSGGQGRLCPGRAWYRWLGRACLGKVHVVDEREYSLGYPRLGYPSAGIPTEGEGTSTMVVHVPEGKVGYAKAGHGTDG